MQLIARAKQGGFRGPGFWAQLWSRHGSTAAESNASTEASRPLGNVHFPLGNVHFPVAAGPRTRFQSVFPRIEGGKGTWGAQFSAAAWRSVRSTQPQVLVAARILSANAANLSAANVRRLVAPPASVHLHVASRFGGKRALASGPLQQDPRPRPSASVAGAARAAVAVIAAAVIVGLLFTIGSIVIGLGLAAALVYAIARRASGGRAGSSAASVAMRPGGRSAQEKTRSTPLHFNSGFVEQQPQAGLPALLLRLISPLLKRAMENAADTAVDVHTVRAEVEDLLSKSRAAADALGVRPQICGVRSIADQRMNHLRTLQVFASRREDPEP